VRCLPNSRLDPYPTCDHSIAAPSYTGGTSQRQYWLRPESRAQRRLRRSPSARADGSAIRATARYDWLRLYRDNHRRSGDERKGEQGKDKGGDFMLFSPQAVFQEAYYSAFFGAKFLPQPPNAPPSSGPIGALARPPRRVSRPSSQRPPSSIRDPHAGDNNRLSSTEKRGLRLTDNESVTQQAAQGLSRDTVR
jgi:hypothetical protein